MAYQELKLKIVGVSPLLMHSGQLADPLNEFTKKMKKVSGKRAKTDADHMELSRLEWHGSLYLKGGAPCIPGWVMEAALVSGARKSKRGKQVEAGLIIPDDHPLGYDGPKDVDKLWADERFQLRAGVKVQRNRVMRTRPMFKGWELEFTVQYDDGLLNKQDVIDIVGVTGEQVGLCDWRPRFGRFRIG